MDEMTNPVPQSPRNPRRKKRSAMQTFKEAYLPVVILALAVILAVTFIVGAVNRDKEKEEAALKASEEAYKASVERHNELMLEAQRLLYEAEPYAKNFDYAAAIAILDRFSGKMYDFPTLSLKREEYTQALNSMVAWDNLADVPNLSFQLLIADPARAFPDKTYGTSYKKNFVTVNEFSAILEQLYARGYILINMEDMVQTKVDENGVITYATKTLYLPAGKKPLMITETNVNYYTYMIDSNKDLQPDKGADGFAYKLVVDEKGQIVTEMVDAQGNVLQGNYDIVPILNAFIKEHPDFSYRGAKATLAVSGYDGLFGYRTNPGAAKKLGQDAYQQELEGARKIIEALRADGYKIACYTYENIAYGKQSASVIRNDLNAWQEEVEPLLGQVDTLVFAQNSDIGGTAPYSGTKFNLLRNAGFRFYLGFADGGTTWASIPGDYVRMHRIMVTGTNLLNNADYFMELFDAATVLDEARG